MQSQWLTVPKPDSGSVSVVPREMLPGSRRGRVLAAHAAGCPGTGLGVNFVGGRTHNWQTVKPFLWHFRCVCLQVYNTRCSATLCHRIPLPPTSPLPGSWQLWQKFIPQAFELHFIMGQPAMLGQRKGKCKCKFCWRHIENSVVAVRPRPFPPLSQIQPSNRP